MSLCFADNDNEKKLLRFKRRYEIFRQRYLKAYEIQNKLRNAEYPKLESLEDKMLLASGISAPIGLYENENGILYSVYECSSGMTYDQFNSKDKPVEETLWDILSIIIQTGNAVSAFHRAGYIVLDIKESNILITGGKDHRTAIQFDFDSLIKKEELKSFSFSDDTILSFTSKDPFLLLPRELKSIHNYYEKGEYRSAEVTVCTRLAEFGERTDIFLIAAILFRRIFGYAPASNMVKKSGDWTLPEESKYITLPYLREKLHKIFSKALAVSLEDRYSNMQEFLNDLRELQSFAVLENPEDRSNFEENGLTWTKTNVSKELMRAYSKMQWEELSGDNGKFSQLVKFSGRFNCKVCLEDENKNQLMPIEAIERSNRTLLLGDGGMGKSTAVFDYWTEQLSMRTNSSKICLYVDLSHFSSIHSLVHESARLNGKTSQDIPINLLTYIEVTILQKFGLNKKAARMNDVLNDPGMSMQMTALQQLFSQNSDNPNFVVILDGFNEILDKSDVKVFEIDLEKAIDSWKNVAIVVTSRTNSNGTDSRMDSIEDNSVLKKLDTYKFIGIPDREIENAIHDKKKFDTNKISELKKDRLWEILKIPMFLNMYFNLHTEKIEAIHTRGELLDRFIMSDEAKTALRISQSSPSENLQHAEMRDFIVCYALSIVANKMDQQRSFNLKEIHVVNNVISAWKIYDDNIGLMVGCLLNITVPVKPNEIRNKIMQIIKTETGYCYKTAYNEYAFTHQYFRDYFAAKHIQNILNAAQALEEIDLSKNEQLQFTKDNGLDYTWSDDVCILLGEIIGDYKNEPGYTEK